MRASSRKGNDKALKVDNAEFKSAVDRVSTIASERGRAVKLNISGDKLVLSVNNPEGGSATEEIGVDYDADAAGDRLQRPLSARHRRPARERDGALPAGRSRLADHGQGWQRRRRALRPDADARVTRGNARVVLHGRRRRPACRRDSRRRRSGRPRVWVERLQLTNFRNYAERGAQRRPRSRSCSPAPTARARPTCWKPSRC